MKANELLKRLRLIYGLSAEEASGELEIPLDQLVKLESGELEPDAATIDRYADYFHFKPSIFRMLFKKDSYEWGERFVRNRMFAFLHRGGKGGFAAL